MSPRVLGLASAGVGPRTEFRVDIAMFLVPEWLDYRAGRCGDHFVDDPILVTLEILIAVLMITLVATKAESHNMGALARS